MAFEMLKNVPSILILWRVQTRESSNGQPHLEEIQKDINWDQQHPEYKWSFGIVNLPKKFCNQKVEGLKLSLERFHLLWLCRIGWPWRGGLNGHKNGQSGNHGGNYAEREFQEWGSGKVLSHATRVSKNMGTEKEYLLDLAMWQERQAAEKGQ